MSEPRLIPFRAEHLLHFVNRDGALDEQLWLLVQKERRGPSWSVVVDDKIICCGGVVIIWQGVGAAWVVFSEEMPSHGLWLTRMTKRVLEDAVRIFKLHRLETMVEASNERYRRWVKVLGFTPENGVARAYTADKKDTTRFERIIWDQHSP